MKVDEQRRKKASLDAVADHEEQQAQVADGQLGVHADALCKRDLRLRRVIALVMAPEPRSSSLRNRRANAMAAKIVEAALEPW